MYALHIFVLCKRKVTLPASLGGEEWAVPWEVVFGTVGLCAYMAGGGKLAGSLSAEEKLPTKVDEEERKALTETFIFLGLAYYGSGYAGQGINFVLCLMAALGAPLTVGMCTSLQVLLSHLLWVGLGSYILHVRTGGNFFYRSEANRWFRMAISGNLVWSVIGGYFVTTYISSLALYINPLIHKLPFLTKVSELLRNLPESQTEVRRPSPARFLGSNFCPHGIKPF